MKKKPTLNHSEKENTGGVIAREKEKCDDDDVVERHT